MYMSTTVIQPAKSGVMRVQAGFPVILNCLYVLFMAIKPVNCDIRLTCKQNEHILQENRPFKVTCTAKDSKGTISGTFKWEHDPPLSQTAKVPVTNDTNNNTIMTRKIDSKTIESTLSVKKPPPVYDILFYYHVSFDTEKQTVPFRLLRENSIPTPKISNGTDFANGSEITVNIAEKVRLDCCISYDNTNQNIQGKIEVSWRKKDNAKNIDGSFFNYKSKSNQECLNHTITVGKSTDGGQYLCWSNLSIGKESVLRSAIMTLKINPELTGEVEKEVKEFAGDDVELHCDIVGYPIVYEWQDEDGNKIQDKNDSRISIKDNVLTIKDVDYSDRKKYICIGKLEKGKSQKQTIVLRVKDPLAPLWPFIGILVEAIVVAAIIFGHQYYKSKKDTEPDGGRNNAPVMEPASSTCT